MDTLLKPILVEFAGLPAAGKTTATNMLADVLRNHGLRASVVPESAALSPLTHLKRDWRFNVWTLCHTTNRLLEITTDEDPCVVIVDRGLFDAFCWIEWFKGNNAITPKTAKTLQAFATMRDLLVIPHFVFFLSVHFDTALARRGQAGKIVNAETYPQLEAAYKGGLRALSANERKSITTIQTDDLSRDDVIECVLSKLGDFVGSAINEKHP